MLATTHERLRAMLEDTRDTMRALKVVTGEMSEEQARLAGASEDALGRWRSAMKDTRAELAALRGRQDGMAAQLERLGVQMDTLLSLLGPALAGGRGGAAGPPAAGAAKAG
jgi:chromosome segregation ATPase